jgi:hypothetical protein
MVIITRMPPGADDETTGDTVRTNRGTRPPLVNGPRAATTIHTTEAIATARTQGAIENTRRGSI